MAGERDAKMDAMANTEAARSLADQPLEQWAFAEVEDDIAEAGKALIGYIDDDGYIRQSLEEIADTSPRDEQGKPLFAEATSPRRSMCSSTTSTLPASARDARCCCSTRCWPRTPRRHPAARSLRCPMRTSSGCTLIADHLDDLVHNRIPQVAKRSGLTIDEIRAPRSTCGSW